MYPQVTPLLELRKTISWPFDPAMVVGFEGRNKRLGKSTIVMKEIIVDDNTVKIPMDYAEQIESGDAELAVLVGNSVKMLKPEDFEEQYREVRVAENGEEQYIAEVDMDTAPFRTFDKDRVKISN
jgi:hypothetical protein